MRVNAVSNCGQPDSDTGKILLGMETLQDAKQTILILSIKSKSIIPHQKYTGVMSVVTIHSEVCNGAIVSVLNCI